MADPKAMVRSVFKAMEEKNFAAFDELLAPDYKNYDMPAPAPGPAGFKQIMGAWHEAFPDLKMNILDVVAEGDRVVTRGIFTGTHRGAFNGIAATGKRVEVQWMDMWVVKNGKLHENWVRLDMMAMLTQLGVMPPR
jgi:steroid delta-isomerase-like uncharacterized protein